MKVAGAIAVLLFGPLMGILTGLVVGVILLPPDPNFVANGGHASPGDGILIILCVFLGLLVSIPLTVWGAVRMSFRLKAKTEDGAGDQS